MKWIVPACGTCFDGYIEAGEWDADLGGQAGGGNHVHGSLICPKCGAQMDQGALTAADGTLLGYTGTDAGAGSLYSRTCAKCGYVELHAEPAAARGETSASATSWGTDSPQPGLGVDHPVRIAAAAFGRLDRVTGGATPRDAGPIQLALILVSAALGIAGPVLLFLASGPVMEVGGFVASGGPYEIAHLAPGWIWIVPVGIMAMMAAFFVNIFVAQSLNRPHLVAVFWTALFGLMGLQFFKHGFNPPSADGVSLAWLACGVVFALLALPGAMVLFLPRMWKGFTGSYAVASVVGLAVGVGGALWVFGALSA